MVPRVGSVKAQVLEWNVAEYKVTLRKGSEKPILQNVVGRAEAGTCQRYPGPQRMWQDKHPGLLGLA